VVARARQARFREDAARGTLQHETPVPADMKQAEFEAFVVQQAKARGLSAHARAL